MLPVTVVVPVRNEEKNLPACLAALGTDFTELVVVDSGSTDRTREIATQAGARVLDFIWDGKFPKKRNWALRNHKFRTPWVLFLDADEQVTRNSCTGYRDPCEHTTSRFLDLADELVHGQPVASW